MTFSERLRPVKKELLGGRDSGHESRKPVGVIVGVVFGPLSPKTVVHQGVSSTPLAALGGSWGRDVGGSDPGFGRAADWPCRPNPLGPQMSGDPRGSLPPTSSQPDDLQGRREPMKGYIARQPKQVKERVEAKLDERLIQKLMKYCEYLDSDRDYVISQALEIAFKKDKGFDEWLASQGTPIPDTPAADTMATARPGRKPPRISKPQGRGLGTDGPAAMDGASARAEVQP